MYTVKLLCNSLFWTGIVGGFLFFLIKDFSQQNLSESVTQRESITFIMGEDSPFYSKAEKYYRYSQIDQTEYVITSCRSLLEVRNHLEENPPSNNNPWGRINIVAHSNEWNGLGIPIIPGSKRTTKDTVITAIEEDKFLPLPNNIVDAQTEIRIDGCALGKDEELLRILGEAFGGDDSQYPVVRSSRYFILYETTEKNGEIIECRKYHLDFWYAFYRPECRPPNLYLSDQLRKRYPDVDLDWQDALNRTEPRWLGDTFHYTFKVPIEWVVTYPDPNSRPDLTKEEAQQRWIEAQIELKRHLENLGIPIDSFEWRFENIDYIYDDGIKEVAIKATGKCTILCVLKALTVSASNVADKGEVRDKNT
jgi:hypothetical protein